MATKVIIVWTDVRMDIRTWFRSRSRSRSRYIGNDIEGLGHECILFSFDGLLVL